MLTPECTTAHARNPPIHTTCMVSGTVPSLFVPRCTHVTKMATMTTGRCKTRNGTEQRNEM